MLVMKKEGSTFERLLYPHPVNEMLDIHWEKDSLYISGRDRCFYQQILCVEDIDKILRYGRHSVGSIELFKGKEILLEKFFVSDRGIALLDKIFVAFSNSYGIVIEHPQQHHQPIRDLCFQLEAELHHRVIPVIFFTPRGNRYHAPTRQHHAALILQIEGELQVTLRNEPVDKGWRLRDGDLLYLPRDRRVELSADTGTSLSLILDIQLFTWADLIVKTVEGMSSQHQEIREALPHNYLVRDKDLAATFSEKWAYLRDHFQMETGFNMLCNTFLETHTPFMDGHFQQIRSLKKIGVKTRVRRRKGCLAFFREQDAKANLFYSASKLSAPLTGSEALLHIEKHESFLVNDIDPLLTDEAKIAIISRLVRGGFLVVEQDDE